MPKIDLPLAAELVVVLLLVGTLDRPTPRIAAPEPPMQEHRLDGRWTVETDLHAQRILRLEGRQAAARAEVR